MYASNLSGPKNHSVSDSPSFWFNKRLGRREPSPKNPQKLTKSEVGAFYSSDSHAFFVAKTSHGQVNFRTETEETKNLFRPYRAAEVKSLIFEQKAMTILSLEDSRKFAREHPEHVIDGTMVDRWKPLDGGLTEPKSRFCVTGWQDPHIHEIERAAPTPSTVSLYTTMQYIASRKWTGYIRDFKKAFGQSKKTNRSQKLACRLPRDDRDQLAADVGIHPEQLLVLETEVYGLVSGPAWWRVTAVEEFVAQGYEINPYDPCVLT